ncbi:MAG TPA: PEGA domain-containing protein [Candidatus Babeliales bacterium]|nr:PEGA domain-containing protein [Candidatus Babeliales bacterium]
MDYLDPRKRRFYNIRLVVGYCLIAVVIALGTLIIVYGANGYGINTKTGQIVQNALLFTDSIPGGAQIYLNGQSQNTTTSARLVLPSGKYTLNLKKDGYRDWTRQFTLNELSVARYVYPFLFPIKPVSTNLKPYQSAPGIYTESPDRRWLFIQVNETSTQSPAFDVYDTTTLDQPTPVVEQLSIPPAILTDYSATSAFKVVEWSSDNDHVLLQHNFSGGNEFLVFSRAHPDESFNINRLFNTSPSQVSLYDKKADQLYVYKQPDATLQRANVGAKTLGPVLIKHVLAYKPYGRDLVTFITDNSEPVGKVGGRIWDNGQTYKLNEFKAGTTYLIDAAKFQGRFYYIVGSDTEDHISIYKDPLSGIKNPAFGKAVALLALHNPGTQKVSFSDNARFIELENGQSFSVYDIETDSVYQYSLAQPLAGIMVWMDGHRLMGVSGGKVLVMDYDGTNIQQLTPSSLDSGPLFSRDFKHMLTIAASSSDSSIVLQNIDLRAGNDLPKR